MATKKVKLIVKHGLEDDISKAVALPNELAVTTDSRKLFVGDDNGDFVHLNFDNAQPQYSIFIKEIFEYVNTNTFVLREEPSFVMHVAVINPASVTFPEYSLDVNEITINNALAEGDKIYIQYVSNDVDLSAWTIIDDNSESLNTTYSSFKINDLMEGISSDSIPELYFESFGSFPPTGDEDMLYIATDEDAIYRWDGTAQDYIPLGGTSTQPTLSISETVYSETSASNNDSMRTHRYINIPNITSLDDLLDKPIYIRSYLEGASALIPVLYVNGFTGVNMYRPGTGSNAALGTNMSGTWVPAGGIYCVVYDGTRFVIMQKPVPYAVGSTSNVRGIMSMSGDGTGSSDRARTVKAALPSTSSNLNDAAYLYHQDYYFPFYGNATGAPAGLTSAAQYGILKVENYNNYSGNTTYGVYQKLIVPKLRRAWERYVYVDSTSDWGTWLEIKYVDYSGDISALQTSVGNTSGLDTDEKEVVGAINEVNSKIGTIQVYEAQDLQEALSYSESHPNVFVFVAKE